VPKCYFVAPLLLCKFEKSFAPVPRTKEAGRATRVGFGAETALYVVVFHLQAVAEFLQKISVAFVRNIYHCNVGGDN
jgi:hypothetical protein